MLRKNAGIDPEKEAESQVNNTLKALFTPNGQVPSQLMQIVRLFWCLLLIVGWLVLVYRFPFFADPLQVLQGLSSLWWDGVVDHILISFRTIAEALLISAVIAFGFAYLSTVPFFTPPAQALSTTRFLGITGLVLVFIILLGGGHWFKVGILVYGMAPYMCVSMYAAISAIPKEEWDHARTLRYSEWRCLWEVAIRGKRHIAAEIVRQSVAMGFMMLTLIEGLQKSEGGLGKILNDYTKTWKFDYVFAIQLLIFTFGFLLDTGLLWYNKWQFSYAFIKLERGK